MGRRKWRICLLGTDQFRKVTCNLLTRKSPEIGLFLWQHIKKPTSGTRTRTRKKSINVLQLNFWIGDIISKVGKATFTSQPKGPEPEKTYQRPPSLLLVRWRYFKSWQSHFYFKTPWTGTTDFLSPLELFPIGCGFAGCNKSGGSSFFFLFVCPAEFRHQHRKLGF